MLTRNSKSLGKKRVLMLDYILNFGNLKQMKLFGNGNIHQQETDTNKRRSINKISLENEKNEMKSYSEGNFI